jgi:hypothetical protein
MKKEIFYYDLSVKGALAKKLPWGAKITIDDLCGLGKTASPDAFVREGLIESLSTFDFDPLCRSKTQRWERVMRTMIFLICGQIPARREILLGRQVIQALPKELKRNIDHDFILKFLPYLLIGFKFHAGRDFASESNRLDDVCRFIVELGQGKGLPTVNSFLCAHREDTSVSPNSLVSNVVAPKLKRTIGLQHGLLLNSPVVGGKIVWRQQEASPHVSASVLPDIFVSYLQSNKIAELLLALDKHQRQGREVIRQCSNSLVAHELLGIDEFSRRVDSFAEMNGGELKKGDFRLPVMEDLLKIAVTETAPAVSRLVKNFNGMQAPSTLSATYMKSNVAAAKLLMDLGYGLDGGSPLDVMTEKTIEFFADHYSVDIYTQALREAAFYFLWGRDSALDGALGIGIDRDFSAYQPDAWRLGYNSVRPQEGVPLIYARRAKSEKPFGLVSQLSFRQFWREAQ